MTSTESKSLFESLHKQHYPMVLQMCLGFMKGDTDTAQDLSQEIFINIWNALEKFQGNASYKTWVYRITVNTCLMHIRDSKKQQSVDLQEAPPQVATASKAAEEQEFGALYEAIGKLSELDRLIIMMVLDELEYDEISKIVGI